MNSSTQGQGLFALWDKHIACNAAGQAGEEQARGGRSNCPFWRAGLANGVQLPDVGVCSKHCVNAGNGVVYAEYVICCETICAETTESPKGMCGNYISCFKQDTVCLLMGHMKWHPGLQTDSACLQRQSGQFNEDCLDFSWVHAYSPASWRNIFEGFSKTVVDALDCWCSREINCSENEYNLLGM